MAASTVAASDASADSDEAMAAAREILAAARPSAKTVNLFEAGELSLGQKLLSFVGFPVDLESGSAEGPPWIGIGLAGALLLYSFLGDHLSLLGDVFFLLAFVSAAEERLGHAGFLLVTVLAVGVSGVGHSLAGSAGAASTEMLGAASLALSTFVALRMPNRRFLMAIPLIGTFAFKMRWRVAARTVWLIYLIEEIFTLSLAEHRVWAAHLAGLGVGLAAVALAPGAAE